MEENTPESLFNSRSFPQKLAGLNYHLIESERGQRKKAYEFLLGLPFFIVVGIFFFRGRDRSSSDFKIEQVIICGLSFLSVFSLTRIVLRFTSEKIKELMHSFERKQDLLLRKILIRYALVYYGVSFVVILILAFR